MAENEGSENKTADLVEYRKKVRQRKLIVKLVIILVLFIGAIIVVLNMDNITESFRGIFSKIDSKTSDEVGYPIKLSGSASYSFKSFGDNFSLLSDTYLYTYGLNGGQNYAIKHSYSKPVHCTNSKRILLYDKDYNGFSFYSKTRLVYKGSVEEKIVFCSMSDNDHAAIVTNSDKYSNIIYIYSGNGEWKYTRKILDENVMNVAFSSDDRYIYVVTIGAENGDIYSKIYKYDITEETDELWSYKLTKSVIPLDIYVKKGQVCVIYDNYAVSVNESDGALKGERELQGTLTCCDNSDSLIALMCYDQSSNKNIIMSLDYEMNVTASGTVYPNIDEIEADGDGIYIVQSGKITEYNGELKLIAEKQLSEDCLSFIKIDNSILFLGFNSINIESF